MLRILSGFGLITGATYPLRALITFGRNPRLWKYIAIPILVNLVVAIALYSGLLLFGFNIVEDVTLDISRWLDSVVASLPTWLGFLEYTTVGIAFLLRIFVILLLLIATGFLLTQFGVLLGAPWYGQLSEQLEKKITGKVEIIEINILHDLGRAILFELKKLVLIAGVGIPLLLLNLFVGIGTVGSTIGSVGLTVVITCLDFLDAPLERRRLAFRQKLKLVFHSLPASASFGFVCLTLISIPLLNLFTIPICVASGTLFFCDRILPKKDFPKAHRPV